VINKENSIETMKINTCKESSTWLNLIDNNNQWEASKKSMKYKDYLNSVRINKSKCTKCKKSYVKLGICLNRNQLSNSNRWVRIRIVNNTLTSLIINHNLMILDKFLKVKNSSQTMIKMKFNELKTQLM